MSAACKWATLQYLLKKLESWISSLETCGLIGKDLKCCKFNSWFNKIEADETYLVSGHCKDPCTDQHLKLSQQVIDYLFGEKKAGTIIACPLAGSIMLNNAFIHRKYKFVHKFEIPCKMYY